MRKRGDVNPPDAKKAANSIVTVGITPNFKLIQAVMYVLVTVTVTEEEVRCVFGDI